MNMQNTRPRLRERSLGEGRLHLACVKPACSAGRHILPDDNRLRGKKAFRVSNPENLQPTEARISPEAMTVLPLLRSGALQTVSRNTKRGEGVREAGETRSQEDGLIDLFRSCAHATGPVNVGNEPPFPSQGG